jgi:predicted DNA-binding protein (MmcQ/YjbR family)
MRTAAVLGPLERRALERLRRISARLPGSTATRSFGHPTFKVAGKSFIVLDRYGGEPCLWLRVDPMERDARLAEPGWFPSPYDPRRVALCCRLESLDWRRLAGRVRDSYTLAALRAPSRRRAAR